MIGYSSLQSNSSSISEFRWHLFLALVFTVAAGEMFFDTYRVVYFGAVSFDDYSHYLLYLLDEERGRVPPSPHVYRIGSVILALPFYNLPFVSLSTGSGEVFLPDSVADAKALAAMCAANVFYLVLTALLVYAYLLRRVGTTAQWAFIGAASVLFLGQFLALEGNDGISVFPLTVALLLAAEKKWKWFLLTVFLGAFINEKIIIVTLLIFGLRALVMMSLRSDEARVTAALFCLFVGFLVVITAFPFPGVNDNQREIGQFITSALSTLKGSTSVKGLYLNVWPVLVLTACWWIAVTGQAANQVLRRTDVLALLAFFSLIAMLNVQFNIGRLVTYFMPFFVVGCIQALAASDSQRATTPRDGNG
ncbi:hypothetical protein [Ruegeria arenilitoris]|uniref:hypothetical protein n=1 Tax=Ruegeria arenilitoris TaxID=1173585 RepID=UPI00147C169F|nr:hypothetical protein [Ruegeria arenilitoris]